jgi:hypothetical protein
MISKDEGAKLAEQHRTDLYFSDDGYFLLKRIQDKKRILVGNPSSFTTSSNFGPKWSSHPTQKVQNKVVVKPKPPGGTPNEKIGRKKKKTIEYNDRQNQETVSICRQQPCGKIKNSLDITMRQGFYHNSSEITIKIISQLKAKAAYWGIRELEIELYLCSSNSSCGGSEATSRCYS